MEGSRIYTLSEAAQKLGVSKELLSEWVDGKIVAPSAVADRAEPFFEEADMLLLEQVRHLHEIGYGTQEIKKIVKKIGLPRPDKLKKRQRKVHRYLTVGELAKRCGLNARTIKYWEERGIIEPTTRSEGGFRLYHEDYVLFCNLIHDLQLFGYSLEEIKEVADLFRVYYDIHTGNFTGSNKKMLEKLDVMAKKIASLFARMDELTKGVERWRKLLKEKQVEIQTLRKKLSKEQQGKGVRATPSKAENPS